MSTRDFRLRRGSSRWYDAWSRYLGLLTVVITLVTTTIVFFATGTELGAVKDLVVACLALLGLVISLQLETLFRVTERARTREQYGRVLEGIEEFPDLLPLVTDALEAGFSTLRHASIPQFKSEVVAVLTHAGARLEELQQGRLRREGSDNTLVLDRFEHTQAFLRGTTDEGDATWWRADDGRRFRELNARLIKNRGVKVERVWILSSPPSGTILELFKEHDDDGVDVFVVRSDRRDLDRRLLVNITIMDDTFLQQDVPNKEGQAVEYLYSENHSDIDRALNTFAQLKARATKYSGPDSVIELFRDASTASAG